MFLLATGGKETLQLQLQPFSYMTKALLEFKEAVVQHLTTRWRPDDHQLATRLNATTFYPKPAVTEGTGSK